MSFVQVERVQTTFCAEVGFTCENLSEVVDFSFYSGMCNTVRNDGGSSRFLTSLNLLKLCGRHRGVQEAF